MFWFLLIILTVLGSVLSWLYGKELAKEKAARGVS
jgi:hypothetical protein